MSSYPTLQIPCIAFIYEIDNNIFNNISPPLFFYLVNNIIARRFGCTTWKINFLTSLVSNTFHIKPGTYNSQIWHFFFLVFYLFIIYFFHRFWKKKYSIFLFLFFSGKSIYDTLLNRSDTRTERRHQRVQPRTHPLFHYNQSKVLHF